jgi:probable rRNA maturation factor
MIAISNKQRARKLNVRLLEQISEATLEELGIKKFELGIVFVSAKEMASINKKFLNHEGPTDVITFDYSEKSDGIMQGEIFICPEEATRQAKEFKTTWQAELVRYVVHGILHLSGHDDLQAATRKKMKRVEGSLVRKLSRRFPLSKL